MTNHLAALKEHIASYYTTDAREEIAWAVAEIEHLTRERDEWAGVAAERNREIANLRSDIAQLRGELSLAEEGLANFAQSAGEPKANALLEALRTIRFAGRNDHPTAVWMQKVAAHAMEPDKWPEQPAKPPTDGASGVEPRAEPELRHDSPDIQFADVLAEAEKGHPVNTQDLVNALWWRVRNQRREIAKLHQRAAEKSRGES